MPVIAAGLRVAAVSNVSIVSVASLIGVSQLGYLLTDGYARFFPTEVVVGIVACVLLALLFDLVILVGQRLLTPWRGRVAVMIADIIDVADHPAHVVGRRRHPATGCSSTSLLRDRVASRRSSPCRRRCGSVTPGARAGSSPGPTHCARCRRLGLLFAVSMLVGPLIQSDLAFVIPSIVVLVLLAIPPHPVRRLCRRGERRPRRP